VLSCLTGNVLEDALLVTAILRYVLPVLRIVRDQAKYAFAVGYQSGDCGTFLLSMTPYMSETTQASHTGGNSRVAMPSHVALR